MLQPYYVFIAKVFIVYHNEGNLSNQVNNLADFLRARCGVDCDIASYHLDEDVTDWNDYIVKCIKDAQYILLVCTKELQEQLADHQHHNRVEMTNSDGPCILSTALNFLLRGKPKTLPIILEEGSRKYIPTYLQSTTIYTIPFDYFTDAASIGQQAPEGVLEDPKYKDLRRLVSRLCGQSENLKPSVASQPPNLTSKIIGL